MPTDALTQLAHKDPACRAGFTVVLDATVPSGDHYSELRPTVAHVRCWSCDTWHSLHASHVSTDRDDAIEGDLRRARREDRPYLADWGSGASLRTLCAAVPVQKVGRVQLHAERRSGFGSYNSTEDVYEWLVTDADGNVVGVVMRYRGQRGGNLYRCGLGVGLGTLGEGFKSPASAAKRVAVEAGL